LKATSSFQHLKPTAGHALKTPVDPRNAGIADPEVRKKKLNAELANGRLAMFAIIGMFFQDPHEL